MRNRNGVALIETLIALVVLAFAGAGMISLLAQTLNSVHGLHERERDTTDAARLLEVVASLSHAQLVASVGVTRETALWLSVEQPAPSLFHVVIRDTLHRAELLHTTIYRPDSL